MKKKLNSNYNNDSFYQSSTSRSKTVSPPAKGKTSPSSSANPIAGAQSKSTFDKLQSLLVTSNSSLSGSFTLKDKAGEDVKMEIVDDYDDDDSVDKVSPRNGASYDEYDDAKMERKVICF